MEVIDTHTGGEPTRVVVAGGPDLGGGSMADRLAVFRDWHDDFRSAVINEPRGSDAMVGALLCDPPEPGCRTGVIFFNNVGFLGMCGHGTIGVAAALAELERIGVGKHRFATPVGAVEVLLEDANYAVVENVASRRTQKDVRIDVPGEGLVLGDVAWGGNWFFLVDAGEDELTLSNVESLTQRCRRIRRALKAAGVAGDDGAEIDHIELFGPARTPTAHCRNFVLCPGDAYDRSPCGTGTSAKVACLAADGQLAEEEIWRQEGFVGSIFEATYRVETGCIVPRIRGQAYVIGRGMLHFHPSDPFANGIRRCEVCQTES